MLIDTVDIFISDEVMWPLKYFCYAAAIAAVSDGNQSDLITIRCQLIIGNVVILIPIN